HDGGRGSPRGRTARTGLPLIISRFPAATELSATVAGVSVSLLLAPMRTKILGFILVCLALSASIRSVAALDNQTLEIAGKTGVHIFAVELAATPEDRERGLMYRRELPEGQGMLFDFERDQEVSFWMKNTYIPLDM